MEVPKIYKFTYTDYIIYQQIRKLGLNDVNESYHYGQNKINQYHDKIFKDLFTNKKETALFINKYLGLKGTKNEIKEKDLQKCDTEYITKEKEKLELDILYKLKEKEIYFLIEHQSTVDFSMAERIYNRYHNEHSKRRNRRRKRKRTRRKNNRNKGGK